MFNSRVKQEYKFRGGADLDVRGEEIYNMVAPQRGFEISIRENRFRGEVRVVILSRGTGK